MSDVWRAIVEGLKEGLTEGAIKGGVKISALAHMLGACVLLKWAYQECPVYGYVIATLTAVILAVAEVDLLLKITGREVWFFDLSHRSTKLGIGGIAIAYLLAGFLLAGEIQSGRRAEESRKEREIYDAEYKRKLNSPEVKAGMEAMARLKTLQEQRAAQPAAGTRPATRKTTTTTTTTTR